MKLHDRVIAALALCVFSFSQQAAAAAPLFSGIHITTVL